MLQFNKVLAISPFNINKLGSRSLDYEWRTSLKQGDKVDIYYGRKGWLLFEVNDTTITEEGGEKVIMVSCSYNQKLEQEQEAYSSEEEGQGIGTLSLT